MLNVEKEILSFPGPVRVLRNYNSFTSFFRVLSVWDYASCNAGDKILLVGDGGGKDYWYFTWNGLTCDVVDIAEQSLIGEVKIHDISAPDLPFAPETFDVVVMCDVLEHIYNDVQALANIRVMLKESGRLVLSGPYWHDAPDHHVRIHTPRIVERILRHHGYEVKEMIARGFLVNLYRTLHPLFLLYHFMIFILFGRIEIVEFNKKIYKMILGIQKRPIVPYLDRLLFGMRGGLNGYVLWAKKEVSRDYDIVSINRKAFTNMSG